MDGASGSFDQQLPSGLFKIKTRLTRAVKQNVILLDGDWVSNEPAVTAPPLSVPPINTSATSHEYHAFAPGTALALTSATAPANDEAVLMVMARVYSGRQARNVDARPWEGVSVVDERGRTIIDLERDGQRNPPRQDPNASDQDPFAICVRTVKPGAYFLRQKLNNGSTIDQSLVACAKWRLEAYVLRQVAADASSPDWRPRVSILMRRPEVTAPLGESDQLIETARIALADERAILNADLELLLLQKFDNPIAGLIGGHLLLVEHERDPGRNTALLDTVVRNLISLVGNRHPDVVALSQACADPQLRQSGPLPGPPMFARSWELLCKAAQTRPQLLPGAVWKRAVAQAALPPFLVWSVDEGVRSAAIDSLRHAVLGASPAAARAGTAPATAPIVAEAAMAFAPAASLAPAAAPKAAARKGPSAAASQAVRQRASQMNVPPAALRILRQKQSALATAEAASHNPAQHAELSA